MRLRPLIRGRDALLPTRRQLAVFGGYLAAAAVYVGIGVYEVDFLLSYWVAVAYVLVTVWIVPSVVRRLR
ncbi:MAG TPA: hypothetical protein VFA66_10755 [Gaiellaceae bacterium]|nr:hypothetical protein [Gaiellaceae bacterium]